jgi:Tfp pilus assembly protein PilX
MSAKPSLACASCHAPRSRGIVLFVALLVMVALSIAGVALMRSTDAATAVTGNLVLKQAASLAVDRGIERAVHALWRRRRSSTARSTPRSRISTRAFAPLRAVAWRRTARVPKIPDLLLERQRVLGVGLASGLIANDDAGNRSCYVIERMCLAPGPADPQQLQPRHRRARRRSRHRALHRTDPTGDAYYRVTVRVEGPRNTVTYAQAVLK